VQGRGRLRAGAAPETPVPYCKNRFSSKRARRAAAGARVPRLHLRTTAEEARCGDCRGGRRRSAPHGSRRIPGVLRDGREETISTAARPGKAKTERWRHGRRRNATGAAPSRGCQDAGCQYGDGADRAPSVSAAQDPRRSSDRSVADGVLPAVTEEPALTRATRPSRPARRASPPCRPSRDSRPSTRAPARPAGARVLRGLR
jgi:hypothetical protein